MGGKHMKRRSYTFLYGFLAFNVVWYIAAVCIQSPVLVNPLNVYKSFNAIFWNGIWTHISASLLRIQEGLILALAIGIPIGLLMFNSRKTDKVLSPLLYFSYPVPKLALLPVVMLLLGIGETAKVVMILLILVFQIIVTTRDAARHISSEKFHVLRSLGANNFQVMRWIIFPAITPEILTSVRVATGTAVSVLFFTETYGTDRGMGFYIVDAWMRLAYTQMYAGILILSLVGFFLFFLTDLLEECLCKWKNNHHI